GIKFINDTCATMPDAAIAALKSLPSKKTILICGGTDKNLDFGEFAKILPKFVKLAVFLPGSATEKIKTLLPPFLIVEAADMNEAVQTAFKNAERGDTVLLSPAAASFGLFKNEFDRGEKFKKAVFKLIWALKL
ncbi:MAG: UDP-N-acetylmuramoyl-L-alanine--D-glutamate ligase, partial [bacterium]|nr:UDP-N-acetylmuramoyl-L-alanine--D-glutamate ligase [bacterium]